jgi:uracil phosphoribosyltransferase
MSKVIPIDHPLVQHKLSLLRDKETGCKAFRELVYELAMLMAYEVTRDLELKEVEIETPICKTKVKTLANEKIAVIPILRAGLGMADGIMSLIPNAKMGHIGLYRNPDTLMPTGYYCKLPQDIEERETIIVDPMLATGN